MKKYTIGAFILLVITIFPLTAFSKADSEYSSELLKIEILKGTDEGLESDKSLTIAEAAVMMVRMLGKEEIVNYQQTKSMKLRSIPNWAEPYVSYLQNNNYLNFLSKYSLNVETPISCEDYVKLMLLSLGYKENIDFTENNVMQFCINKGILSTEEAARLSGTNLIRQDAFYITYLTLKSKVAGSNEYAVHKLARDNFSVRMGLKTFDGGKFYDANLLQKGESELIDLWNLQTSDITDKSHYDSASRPVIFFGDSLTEGLTMTDNFEGFNVLNRGVNGNTTEDLLERLDKDVVKYKPRVLFIMAGTNNLWKGDSIDSIKAEYEKLLAAVKKTLPDCKVYVQENIPFGTAALSSNPYITKDKLISYNVEIQKITQKFGYEYLFIGDIYSDKNKLLDAKYTRDGIHLKLEYYYLWIKEIKSRI